ncbi:MAG: polymer-forming cytoskeletal protein [Clostridia bacterium]|nr:polymer-forming cytoskeletal protein [Clostridia bacterium]
MKKSSFYFISLFTLILLFFPFLGKTASLEAYKNIKLEANETISGNLYAISPKIVIDGELEGDLIAISQNIELNGRVNGDLIAIAENINITGEINGNLRVAAKKLIINGIIARNVNYLSQDFIIAENGKIGWDLLGLSQNNLILGLIQGGVDISSQKTELKGRIQGDLKLHNQKNASLNIHPKAIIEGDLYYQNNLELIRHNESQVIGLSYEIANKTLNKQSLFTWWQIIIYKIISAFIIACLLIKIKRNQLFKLNAQLKNKAWLSLLWGLAFIVLTPLLIVLLTATIVGIPLALIIIGLFLVALFLSQVISALFLGLTLLKYIKYKKKNNPYLAVLIGIVIIALLTSIPIVGYFIYVLISSLAIGLILININK